MSNFWQQLNKPILALAPMADVTDCAFREMFVRCGKPDVMWTEFVSADGLFLAPEQGREFWLPDDLRSIAVEHGIASDNPLLKDLIYTSAEQPIVAQFFSRDPDRMRRAARLCVALGFAGIDINMGCPARVIVKQGAGCAMIREPDQAIAVINATIEGASGQIPVSVKTRTGFASDNEQHDWATRLLETDIATLTMHARTRQDMSKVPARWENISKVVSLRDRLNPNVVILGNGDVTNLDEAEMKIAQTGCDGVMIGRGIFGNPWLFNKAIKKTDLSDQEIVKTLLEHSDLFNRYLGDTKSFALMKKHYKTYLSNTDLDKSAKQSFIQAGNYEEVIEIARGLGFTGTI